MTSLKILTASVLSVLLMTAPASAASKSAASNKLGIDIAWPQCGLKVPTDQAFGIVDINSGLANETNPCLKDQLIWASKSLGGTKQDKAQVYVNTANPGGLNTASWPSNNVDPQGVTTDNPYGTCNHSDSWACAWQYGWNRAVEDVTNRFSPVASSAQLNSDPAGYVWWLDVETSNTWKTGGSTFDNTSNTADIEGMTAYLKLINARVGIYSTAKQWKQIVGSSVSVSSNLNGLLNWRPGGASLSTAQAACGATPLTTGGSVVLTQFISRSLDYDYSCIN